MCGARPQKLLAVRARTKVAWGCTGRRSARSRHRPKPQNSTTAVEHPFHPSPNAMPGSETPKHLLWEAPKPNTFPPLPTRVFLSLSFGSLEPLSGVGLSCFSSQRPNQPLASRFTLPRQGKHMCLPISRPITRTQHAGIGSTLQPTAGGPRLGPWGLQRKGVHALIRLPPSHAGQPVVA